MDKPYYEYVIVPKDSLPEGVGPFDPAQKCWISLRSNDGEYMYVHGTEPIVQTVQWYGTLKVGAPLCSPDTKFLCYPVGEGKVVLHSNIGKKWVQGVNRLTRGYSECRSDAVFEVVKDEDYAENTIALKSMHINQYLSADKSKNGSIQHLKSEVGFNEQWTVVVHEYVHDDERPVIIEEQTAELVVDVAGTVAPGAQVCDNLVNITFCAFCTFGICSFNDI